MLPNFFFLAFTQVFVQIIVFFYFQSVISWNCEIHNLISILLFVNEHSFWSLDFIIIIITY